MERLLDTPSALAFPSRMLKISSRRSGLVLLLASCIFLSFAYANWVPFGNGKVFRLAAIAISLVCILLALPALASALWASISARTRYARPRADLSLLRRAYLFGNPLWAMATIGFLSFVPEPRGEHAQLQGTGIACLVATLAAALLYMRSIFMRQDTDDLVNRVRAEGTAIGMLLTMFTVLCLAVLERIGSGIFLMASARGLLALLACFLIIGIAFAAQRYVQEQ